MSNSIPISISLTIHQYHTLMTTLMKSIREAKENVREIEEDLLMCDDSIIRSNLEAEADDEQDTADDLEEVRKKLVL